ncbi:hypothetical protein QUF72_09810, partial [Desulfobacterales bacterium HSG2]|nr:hypothetical protein [Desulfobacterales bacterium HSG2]
NVRNEMEYIIHHISISKFGFSMNWRFVRLIWKISVIINAARLMLLQGSDSCKIPLPIIKQYYNVIRDICDNLILIRNQAGKSVFLFPIKKILDAVLPEWLELAEDFAISSDDEIRDLLGQIADAF